MRPRRCAAALGLAAVLSACGHTAPSAKTAPGARTPPDLAGFLRQPVATPSVCPPNAGAAASGRRSPWVGHVDLSVFLMVGAPPRAAARIRQLIRRNPLVERSYYEDQAQAYAEFQRLYTCWAHVARSQTPASFRVSLTPTTTIAQRNRLVAQLLREPGVDTVSCDPALPCTDIVQSASAVPTH